MKINDIKRSNLNEGWEDWFGAGASTIKSALGMGKNRTPEQQRALDMFLKDFVGDAWSTLEQAIEGGLVDPNMAGPQSASSTVDPATVTPGPAAANKPMQAKTKQAASTQRATTQNINNYIQSAAKTLNSTTDKNQKLALTKELVNFMADRKDYPEWQNALSTVQQVIKGSRLDPNFTAAAVSRLKQGQRLAEAWQVYYINQLIESVGFSWNDLGISLRNGKNGYYIAETKYVKLNNIFESILQEAESISDYLKNRWFPAYMRGVQYDNTAVEPLFAEVEKTWAQDQGKAALTRLAKAAYALSKSPGQNATSAQPDTTPAARPATTEPATDLAGNIKSQLAKLKASDPAAYAELLKTIPKI